MNLIQDCNEEQKMHARSIQNSKALEGIEGFTACGIYKEEGGQECKALAALILELQIQCHKK